jgi:hypothetical protein
MEGISMRKPKILDIDPYLHRSPRSRRLPTDRKFICMSLLHVGIDNVYEDFHLHQTGDTSELWACDVCGTGPRVVMERSGQSEVKIALDLLDALICERAGFSWPAGFERAGIVSEAEFVSLVARIETDLAQNRKVARLRRSGAEIVETAKRLSLYPEPSGDNARAWSARCPGTNHFIDIDPEADLFRCGWCRRHGRVKDLEVFAAERGRARNAARVRHQPHQQQSNTGHNLQRGRSYRDLAALCLLLHHLRWRACGREPPENGGSVRSRATRRDECKLPKHASRLGQHHCAQSVGLCPMDATLLGGHFKRPHILRPPSLRVLGSYRRAPCGVRRERTRAIPKHVGPIALQCR